MLNIHTGELFTECCCLPLGSYPDRLGLIQFLLLYWCQTEQQWRLPPECKTATEIAKNTDCKQMGETET